MSEIQVLETRLPLAQEDSNAAEHSRSRCLCLSQSVLAGFLSEAHDISATDFEVNVEIKAHQTCDYPGARYRS